MQILLANAKIMRETTAMQPASRPAFKERARALAREMGRMDIDMLAKAFHCNRMIAAENACRYANFEAAQPLPALWAYNGQAYKHLRADTLSEGAVAFAQQHLWITCFLYGLLRPLDAIVHYRMEPDIRLEATGDRPEGLTAFAYEGFRLAPGQDDDHTLCFVRDDVP